MRGRGVPRSNFSTVLLFNVFGLDCRIEAGGGGEGRREVARSNFSTVLLFNVFGLDFRIGAGGRGGVPYPCHYQYQYYQY